MSTPSLEDVLAQVMLDDGWTCEYHEPDADCGQCRSTVARTVGLMLAEIREHWHIVAKAGSTPGAFGLPEWFPGLANNHADWVVWTSAAPALVMVQRVEPGELTPTGARVLAAAFLSAADVAEAQS